MNKELLLKVAEYIKDHPDEFCFEYRNIDHEDKGCIAYHVCKMQGKLEEATSASLIHTMARDELGIDRLSSNLLFIHWASLLTKEEYQQFCFGTRVSTKELVEIALLVINRFIERYEGKAKPAQTEA